MFMMHREFRAYCTNGQSYRLRVTGYCRESRTFLCVVLTKPGNIGQIEYWTLNDIRANLAWEMAA